VKSKKPGRILTDKGKKFMEEIKWKIKKNKVLEE
jgi:ribosomal protein S19E (S16A)